MSYNLSRHREEVGKGDWPPMASATPVSYLSAGDGPEAKDRRFGGVVGAAPEVADELEERRVLAMVEIFLL